MSSLFVIFFLGGGMIFISNFFVINSGLFSIIYQDFFFILKVIFITFLFIFVRANLPRFRFDQLMFIG